ncbi:MULTISPECIES: type IV toxin-antitoxin system AbiEi family antitoxin [Microbacterium]|uniref:type IV toxin-antitoxin system AbiEi family antitoxin n=1 Tax=Microbacterium TaxID=33882 RepID=UPI0010CA262C|nr:MULTISPECIES: type IV toxin-antitoxin system AbiEi family antitoxin [Microbacterium]QCQ15980.1 hypothetical protein EHF32_04140 [Microbacterium sp. RG1]UIN29271.1 hypothetical protein LXM64_08785 [Microbacterium binotii]
MGSRFLYFPSQLLSRAELTAACLDGDLVGLGEGFVPADTIETAALRAASLHPLVGERMAATHRSAAWVHGFIDEVPVRHDLQRISEHRLHEPVDRRFVYRDPRIPDDDLLRLGGVPVTTPARTVADLARGTDEAARGLLGQCAERAPEAIHGAIAWLDSRRRVPRRLAALALLQELVRKM